jgi:hypothetical protein
MTRSQNMSVAYCTLCQSVSIYCSTPKSCIYSPTRWSLQYRVCYILSFSILHLFCLCGTRGVGRAFVPGKACFINFSWRALKFSLTLGLWVISLLRPIFLWQVHSSVYSSNLLYLRELATFLGSGQCIQAAELTKIIYFGSTQINWNCWVSCGLRLQGGQVYMHLMLV